jgi:hypothetical protein
MGKTPFEKYQVEEVHRSKLTNAPYNPRILSEKARKLLQKNVKERGLLLPPIWNVTTGHIVGGHQRVAVLDSLMGTHDYSLSVSKVALTEKEEREQNVFLNNAEAQGEWDLEKLEGLIKLPDFSHDDAGLTTGDILQLFGEPVFNERPEVLAELSAQLRAAKERIESHVVQADDEGDVNFYLVVVFKNYEQRQHFTQTLKLPDNRFQDGRALLTRLVPEEVHATLVRATTVGESNPRRDETSGVSQLGH